MITKKIISSILLLTVFFSNISTINVFAEEKNDENKVVQVEECINNEENQGNETIELVTEEIMDNSREEDENKTSDVEEINNEDTTITEEINIEEVIAEEVIETEEDLVKEEESITEGYNINSKSSDVYEREKNNTPKTANVIGVNNGKNYKGYMLDSNDVDYYKFTIDATSQVQFNFSKSNNAIWKATIYDINQKQVLSFNASNRDKYIYNEYAYKRVGLKKGTYYLKLEGREDLTYSFSVTATAGNYEEEANNTKADATVITTNKKYYGRFDRYDDIDYYKVVIPKNGELYVDFEPNGYWDRYDFKLTLIGENGEKYDIAGYYRGYNSSEPLGIKAGTYYLQIADTVYTDNDKENNYNFILKYKENNYFEVEGNDTKETANTIKVNNKYYGASNNDEDYYKLTLNDDMYVKFEFNNDEVGHIVTLSDTLGNRYVDLKTTTSKYTTSKSIKLGKGTYYLNVKALGGKYSFKIFDSSDWGIHWANNEIKSAMKKNWVKTTEKFRPNDAITRAEFIKIVNKAFGFKAAASSEKFSDVTSKDWWYNEVLIALKAGYITSKNSRFRPNDPITREEVASIITSIKNNKDSNLDKIKKYTDFKNVSTWARSSVEGAIEAGYMGKGSNTFRPKANITRAEAVVTLSRIK